MVCKLCYLTLVTCKLGCLFLYFVTTALSIALTNTSVEGSEGENITVCATIDSIENIILEIPVIATFEQSPLSGFPGKHLLVSTSSNSISLHTAIELNGDIDIDGVFTFTGMSPSAPVCVDVELLEDRTLEGQEGVALELNVTSVPSVSVNESMDMIQVLITDTNSKGRGLYSLNFSHTAGRAVSFYVVVRLPVVESFSIPFDSLVLVA